MFSQIPTPRPASPEAWAAITTAAGAVAVVIKKLMARAKKPTPEYITRAEFHHRLDTLHSSLSTLHLNSLALADKLDTSHRDTLAALERQSATFERRIDQLETSLARVDERTKS